MGLAATLFLLSAGLWTDAGAAQYELHFECKLLLRERWWGRRVEVDQWAGAVLAMRRERTSDGDLFRLTGVVETPWTLRWYPTKNEVKLGAAVHVARPAGDPYGALAPRLERLATAKYRAWWDADAVVPGAPWAEETGRFWARRHRAERHEKDALTEPPSYPFHVLGPLEDRLVVAMRGNGAETLRQDVTEPWLPDGWSRWLRGERPSGYGFWESRRPRWEPRLYEALAAAQPLLAEAPPQRLREILAEVVATLQPRAAGRVVALVDDERLRLRVWRRDPASGAIEVQLLLDDRGEERRKVWLRVAYMPVERAASVSGSVSTNARISSRTRR